MTKRRTSKVCDKFGIGSSLHLEFGFFDVGFIFFRKRRPHFGDDDKGEADRDQKERKELAARETGDQRRIRFAKIFDDDPEDRVANKKQGRSELRSVAACACARTTRIANKTIPSKKAS